MLIDKNGHPPAELAVGLELRDCAPATQGALMFLTRAAGSRNNYNPRIGNSHRNKDRCSRLGNPHNRNSHNRNLQKR